MGAVRQTNSRGVYVVPPHTTEITPFTSLILTDTENVKAHEGSWIE